MAPEIWINGKYSESSDVYAFALIVYEIMTLKKPFKNVSLFILGIRVKDGDRSELDDQIPSAFKYLIKRCWCQDPSNRPIFQQIWTELSNNQDFLTKNVDKKLYFLYIKYNQSLLTLFEYRYNFQIYFKKKKKSKQ